MKLMRSITGGMPVKMIIIIVAALGLCLGGLAVTKVMKKGKGPMKPVVSEMKLEEFVVNLADRGDPRYLKVNLTLEVEGPAKVKPASGEGGEGKTEEDPKVRDAVITVLTRKKFNEILTETGKEKLKEELKTELNKVMKDQKVTDIFFTSFAMQ